MEVDVWKANCIWDTEREICKYNQFDTAWWKTAVYHEYGCQLQGDRRGLDAETFGKQYQHSFESFTGIEFCGTKRYTTCEQELSAVVYAVEKFRIHVYGNKLFVNTDNRVLIFLQKCGITLNRVAKWLITIKEYDIELQHIKGIENLLAYILSRNPTGI